MIYVFRNHIISDCLRPGRDFNQKLAVFLLISPIHDTLVFLWNYYYQIIMKLSILLQDFHEFNLFRGILA